MRIPESKIEEIRSSANIVDVISQYVQLKKRGKNFIGLCPFHQEKTPSFTVSDDKQIYHCFGCHAGGNVFKFLMDYNSISFVEAVQEVGESLGIKLEYDKDYDPEKQSEQELLYDINVSAAKYFSDMLLKSTKGEIAREYFKRRSIKPQTQRVFGLGYAPTGWDNFLLTAKEKKIDLQKAKMLGLLDTKDEGGYYDKFRGRIIFPIFSPNGRVIAFGGRVLEKDAMPKYLNSPESMIYLKRKSLYGLYHAKDEIRKQDKAILVEGYMDVISLYQHGIKNVIASSGTALTDDQVKLLSRFTKNIVVIFDADIAGQKASLRSIEVLLKNDFDLKVVSLPEGEDPDSFVQEYGKDEFDEVIGKAKNFLEYQTARYESDGMFEDPHKQTEAIRKLVQTAALISDELKRNILIKNISKKFNLREKLIESELDKFLKQTKSKEERQAAHTRQTPQQQADEQQKQKKKASPLEKELIKLLFSGDESIVGYILDNVHPEDFGNDIYIGLAELVHEAYKENIVATSALIDKINDENERTYIMRLVMERESISRRWVERAPDGNVDIDLSRHAYETVRKYKVEQINDHIKANNIKIQSSGSEDEMLELMRLNRELQDEKKLLLAEEEKENDI